MTTACSQSVCSASIAARAVSNTDPVPRLPTPCWIYTLPSGRIVSNPSMPAVPPAYELSATPMPVTAEPVRWPLFAFIASQLNAAAPLSTASLTNALDTVLCCP